MPVSNGKATALTEVHKAMAAPTEPVTRVKRSGRPGRLCGIFMETSTVIIVVTEDLCSGKRIVGLLADGLLNLCVQIEFR
ncbi:hypothetical protein D3C84_517280 [compost metagenome]